MHLNASVFCRMIIYLEVRLLCFLFLVQGFSYKVYERPGLVNVICSVGLSLFLLYKLFLERLDFIDNHVANRTFAGIKDIGCC